MKKTEIKTNAMRILEKNKIPYEAIQYECDEFIDDFIPLRLQVRLWNNRLRL